VRPAEEKPPFSPFPLHFTARCPLNRRQNQALPHQHPLPGHERSHLFALTVRSNPHKLNTAQAVSFTNRSHHSGGTGYLPSTPIPPRLTDENFFNHGSMSGEFAKESTT
jgi:hypothetical protein